MKFIANLLVAIHNVSAAEALVLAMKAGLDPELAYRVVGDGAGSSRMFQVRGPMMVRGDYRDATMKVDVWQKDRAIIADFARARMPDAAVPRLGADLHRGARCRARQAGHRLGVRDPGGDGGRQAPAPQAALALDALYLPARRRAHDRL